MGVTKEFIITNNKISIPKNVIKEYNKADQYYSDLLTLKNSNIDSKEIKRRIKAYKK